MYKKWHHYACDRCDEHQQVEDHTDKTQPTQSDPLGQRDHHPPSGWGRIVKTDMVGGTRTELILCAACLNAFWYFKSEPKGRGQTRLEGGIAMPALNIQTS